MENHSGAADIILRSSKIFTGDGPLPGGGHVAVKDGAILAVGAGPGGELAGPNTKVYELGDKLVCPGFIDTHLGFPVYLMGAAGADLSTARTPQDVLAAARAYAATKPESAPVLGHSLDTAAIPRPGPELLEEAFGGRPVVLAAADRETCWMNKAAEAAYGFTPDTFYAEACVKLIAAILEDGEQVKAIHRAYQTLFFSRGVTTTKEMCFDDGYGMPAIWAEMEAAGELKLRTHFMSQPVAEGMNLAAGRAPREKYTSPRLRFSGFNRMTDGSISQTCGDMKAPYLTAPTCCSEPPDYALFEKEVLAADAEGFRYTLHAQGDAAVAKVLDIFEKCEKGPDGKLVRRFAITDLECADPADYPRMARLGIAAEVYPQIPALYDFAEKSALTEKLLGPQRAKNYWNRRALLDAGVSVGCATDCPLMPPDIPESVYYACGGYLGGGAGGRYNPQNAITVEELLRAWTRGSAWNLGCEESLGKLAPGMRADIAVLDKDLRALPMEQVREASVCLTLVDGEVVFEQ